MIKIYRRMIVCALPLLLGCASAAAQVPNRYAGVVDGILAAWKTADVVCLGEDHGRQYDSDMRIALVRHPEFPRTVRAVIVEFANPVRQRLLDEFILDGVPMSREQLAPIWRDANGAAVWESVIYEQFLRAVHDVNRGLRPEQRVRVLAGDSEVDWARITRAEDLLPLMNRGANIRNNVAEKVLDKNLKGLAIFGAGHCSKLGRGFPGDLAGRYTPGRIWAIWPVFRDIGAQAARSVFGVADQPAYIIVSGTRWASTPAGDLLFTERRSSLGEVLDALVYHGAVRDSVVKADLTQLNTTYGVELARRRKLTADAAQLRQRRGSN